ncbi:GIY-YIG nuclease family protein [Streptomyces sp. NPDC005799]|uniref:GIY-YIG nuclease family protein n=1 Tax=Streptomyces sp. NPDC005799 TaxID=3154678 RepID=UPI0033F0A1B4
MMQGQMPQPGVGDKGAGETAVYRLSDADGNLLYVGIGRNPMARWASHADQHAWWPRVTSFEVAWYPSREEAAAEERRALREDGPACNIHGTPGWGAFLARATAECRVQGNKAHRDWANAHPEWRSASGRR